MKSEVVVIQFPGVNCEYETVRALEAVGLGAGIMRWNEDPKRLREAAGVIIPGGFSYQDRIRAGVVAAKDRIMDEILEAVTRDVPVMGICNGAQILVEAGAVTGFGRGDIDLVLAPNDMPERSGYLCRWIHMKKGPTPCLFTEFLDATEAVPVPMAHGEGRFVTVDPNTAARLERGEGVALTYAHCDGSIARSFPANPNGSAFAIAGVTNPRGNVLAIMPHPERAAWLHQVPRRVGGAWAERRQAASVGELFAAGPGRGFFESLCRGVA